MSKSTWELSAEDISDILTVNKKTFNYLKNTLSRFFLQVTKEGIDLYFKDNAGILKYHKDVNFINPPATSKMFAVDFQKFINSLRRFQVQGALINLDDTTISIVDINNNTTVVKLSATVCDDDLDGILNGKEKIKDTLTAYDHSSPMNEIFQLTSKLMNNGNPNNCLAIINGEIATYADRSLIYKDKCITSFKESLVSIHSFLVGFIMNTYELQASNYYFDFDNNGLYFKSKDIEAYLLSEKPDVNIPSDSDLANIRPDVKDPDVNIITISAIELSESLDFFEGFFERDVWKPITFIFKKKDQRLSYESPVTSVDKPFDSEFTVKQETEFTLMSTPLQAVLQDILAEGNDVEIEIVEKPDMPGVSIKIKDQDFELVLAKLNF